MNSNYKKMLVLILIGLFIGFVVGILDTIFGKILIKITEIRDENKIFFIPFLAIGGIFIFYIYKKWGKNSIKGMSLIFEVFQNEEEKIPLRLIPFVILSTWVTHLFGGSAGREGVAVQIGATFSSWLNEKLKIKNLKRILLITGMSAGFSGLFQTPISAIFFAMEVLIVGKIQYTALLPALISSFTASFVSKFLGLEKFRNFLNVDIRINLITLFKLIFLGIIFGLAGLIFSICLKFFKEYFNKKFKSPFLKIFLISIILSIAFLLIKNGRYSGLGTNLINASFSNGEIYFYDWILKLLFTTITLAIGFQGGEVTPLFSIGAILGAFLASIFNLPIEFVACLGYLSVFGSATNTFLAPIFIGGEVFGFSYVQFFFIVMVFAYTFNFNKSIYSLQKIENS